jgi:hypothetical protein
MYTMLKTKKPAHADIIYELAPSGSQAGTAGSDPDNGTNIKSAYCRWEIIMGISHRRLVDYSGARKALMFRIFSVHRIP